MMPEANSATPPVACPKSESPWSTIEGMRTLHSTSTKASKGAQTIGSLTVSSSFSAKTEWRVVGGAVVPMGVLPNARPRIVIGTTMRLMIRAAIAIVTALALPNRSPRIAGPMNGTAGADAIRAANTLSLNEERNTRRNSRNTRAYKPTIAANIATTNVISWARSARGVPTVPTKSASGTAYNNTMRLRTDASFGPKSWRQAATKPSSTVKTIGASALRMVCTMAPLRLRDYADDAFRCGLRGHLANVV